MPLDRLRAQILLYHARVQRDRLRERISLLEQRVSLVTPKLAAIRQQLGLLQSDVDSQSQGILNKIEAARVRTKTVFAGTHAKVDKAMKAVADQVGDINEFLDGLEQTNGGPSLDGSAESSEAPSKQADSNEPAASWSANKS
jgi:hypothetical protein